RSYGDWSSDVCSSDLAHAQVPCILFSSDPVGRVLKPAREQSYVEAQVARVDVNRLFLAREQVEEERPRASLAYGARNELIARAVATAARAVSEKHDALRAKRYAQLAFQQNLS